MNAVIVGAGVFLAAFAAWWFARAVVRRSRSDSRTMDDTWGGMRKVHVLPTPRIGGVAVAAGLLLGSFIVCTFTNDSTCILELLACALPALVWGTIEDVSKRGASAVRYVLTAAAAALAYFLLDARITFLEMPVLDQLLGFSIFSFLFPVFAVTGVAQSMNLIDGLNGLAGMVALCAALGLAVVAAIVGDTFVLGAACVLAAAVGGFLAVNYPRGRIFLGDGGAYLVGFLLAEISVLLVQRNSEVSPWLPLVLLAYPIWETLFSMVRRAWHGRSPLKPDALHLHTLVYRRVVRWKGFQAKPSDCVTRNSIASLYLWLIPVVGALVGLAFWQDSFALKVSAAAFGVVYTLAYRRLVRFGVPAWLVVRAKTSHERPELDGEELSPKP